MCVYLAPRWRRRLFVLALTLLLTAEARTLHTFSDRNKTEHTDLELTSVGNNSDSESTSVGDTNVGVVTTNLTQSLTMVTDKAWYSGSHRNDSQLRSDKSVSFNNLVKSTSTPSTSLMKHFELLASQTSVSMNCGVMTPCAARDKTNTSNLKQGDDDNDDIDASFDKGSNNAGADISSDIQSTNAIQTGTTNKAATSEPVPPTTLQSASMTHAPPSPSLVVGPFDHRTQGYPSSVGKEPNSTDRVKVLEHETKSAAPTTASRSIDQTLVVVIIGVVGAIGTLVMLVSRRVLKETQDDDLDLEDSRFF